MSALSPEAHAMAECVADENTETANQHKYIAQHLITLEEWAKQSWEDSVIGFMTIDGGKHICAFSASAPDTITTDAVKVVLKTMGQYNTTEFVSKIEVPDRFVSLAQTHGGYPGCAEKKLLAYAELKRTTINKHSFSAWRVYKAHGNVHIEYTKPCKSCKFCMYQYDRFFF